MRLGLGLGSDLVGIRMCNGSSFFRSRSSVSPSTGLGSDLAGIRITVRIPRGGYD